MEKFCRNCGTKLKEDASFCQSCGTRTLSEKTGLRQENKISAPTLAQVAKTQPLQSEIKQTPKRSGIITPVMTVEEAAISKSKHKRGKRSLALILAVVIAANAVLGALLYFFVFRRTTDAVEEKTEEFLAETLAELAEYAATADIPLRYTDEQIKNAPTESAPVSSDGGTVKAGNVSVEFGYYDVEENCELNVRDLPELSIKSNDGNGVGIKAYDLTLSSGQHEFPCDLAVKIPRTVGENETGAAVWFNEEEDRWENIYSEVSDDGNYYLVYIDHFTNIGEKKFTFDPDTLSLSEYGKDVNFDGGLFYSMYGPYGPVAYDQQQIWAMALNGDWKDKNPQSFAESSKTVDGLLANQNYDRIFDESKGKAAGTLFGGSQIPGALSDLMKWKFAPPFVGFAAKICGATDIVFTSVKLIKDLTASSRDSFLTRFVKAVENRGMDIVGSALTLGGMMFSTGPVGWTLFGLSVVLYAYSVYSNYIRPATSIREEWNLWKDKQGFYTDADFSKYYVSTLMFSSPEQQGSYYMLDYTVPRLPSMDDEWYEAFISYYNLYHPDKDGDGKISRVDSTSLWMHIFKSLLLSCNEPSALSTVIDELFEKIASAYWDLEGEKKDLVVEYYRECFPHSTVDPDSVKGYERLRVIKEVKTRLMNEFLPLIKEASLSIIRKSFKDYIDMADEMVKYLNSPVEIYIEDGTVENFKDSVYNFNYKEYDGNKELLNNYQTATDEVNKGILPYYKSDYLYLMLRFHDAKETLYQPLMGLGSAASWDNFCYYPYDLECVLTPGYKGHYYEKPSPNTNMFFACRFYYYLMMGVPRSVDFYKSPSKLGESTSDVQTVDIEFIKDFAPGKTLKGTAKLGEKKRNYSTGARITSDSLTHYDIYSGLSRLPSDNSITLNGDEFVITFTSSSFEKDVEGYQVPVHDKYTRDAFTVTGKIVMEKTTDKNTNLRGYITSVSPSDFTATKQRTDPYRTYYDTYTFGNFYVETDLTKTTIDDNVSKINITIDNETNKIVNVSVNLYGDKKTESSTTYHQDGSVTKGERTDERALQNFDLTVGD